MLLTLHRGLQNMPCQFNFQFFLLILQYVLKMKLLWCCCEGKKCLRKTLLYQHFRSLNKRNSSVWTIVNTIFHLQIVYYSSAVLWFYLIQTKQEWMDITFAHQEKDSCGNKASWPWQWVNNSWVWILLREFIIRPEKCTKLYAWV